MAPVKLTYFNLKALGHPIRLALAAGKVNFEEHKVEFAEWPALKATMPFGQLPVLTIDGKTHISQSGAILRYVGRLGGLYPTHPVDAALVDMVR
jgi:prostaglandin-H2 D-isomerase / glutathione transferase